VALQLDTLAQAAAIEAKRLDEQEAPKEKPICGGNRAKVIVWKQEKQAELPP